ncbi:hypothetical protein GUITHDRAFT_150145 [Guillardia theta CCMP2712]|uniref:Biogenesis of lysosome-related organelles complex 1 subunit 2 n=1 Tax=Guillardia theta (strain CCMP2712) TaxID=905079 RepID=L1K0C1_GUITC|nr:hypothetical protein GUITHDRAFT_150145 [Guillardia theta CCMP2712]EKX54077.1 hypothetical protein GUITHDRAFT_150145 [Guillardia theta CCMP2712]|eukprot:XP_005841057.1 hypothetical protein GUITHDRAFT_150145 [Guillardia theta CCMP2712]
MMEKVMKQMKGDMLAASEEYNLLDKMQTTTEAKMKELVSATSNINENLETLEKKKKELNPLLDQITDLETSVDELLNTAQLLDDYSKKIESKYKEIIISRRS